MPSELLVRKLREAAQPSCACRTKKKALYLRTAQNSLGQAGHPGSSLLPTEGLAGARSYLSPLKETSLEDGACDKKKVGLPIFVYVLQSHCFSVKWF